jgi:hypothetical protein
LDQAKIRKRMARKQLSPLNFQSNAPMHELLAPENSERFASWLGKSRVVHRHGALLHKMSSARPSGELARPWESRSRALRITLTGTPYCSAMLATTALSFAAASMSEPARPLPKNISATTPVFGK